MLINHPKKNRIVLVILSLALGFTFCSNPRKKTEKSMNSVVDSLFPDLPKSMSFFGQPCSLRDVDIRERLDREIMVNTYFQSSTSLIIKRSSRYFPVIESILRSEGVPEDFKYLCVIESNLSNVTSPAGAAGFWQFMPFTAPEYELKISSEIDERLHLEKSTRAACKLIKSNYKLFQNWLNACAAYNRGPGGLARDLSLQGVDHYFDAEMNPETARYVFRIMAIKLILENPEMYGYHLPHEARYPAYHTRKITITKPILDLTSWSLNQGINRKILRILNPWILGNQLTKSSLPCTIELPTNRSLFIPRHSV